MHAAADNAGVRPGLTVPADSDVDALHRALEAAAPDTSGALIATDADE